MKTNISSRYIQDNGQFLKPFHTLESEEPELTEQEKNYK